MSDRVFRIHIIFIPVPVVFSIVQLSLYYSVVLTHCMHSASYPAVSESKNLYVTFHDIGTMFVF